MKSFEERLKSDVDFRERVSAITFLSKGIKERQERDAKAIEDAQKISKEDVISTIKEITDREEHPSGGIIPLWVKRVAAAAAVVLIVVGVGFDYYNSSLTKDYAGQCIAMAESDMSGEMHMKGDGDEVIDELRKLFELVGEKENLPSVISKLEVYYDHAIDEYAHDEDAFVDQISLALASAYIYDGQKSKAKEVLSHILNDPEASPDIKEKAKQLLDSIKKTFIF